MEFETVRYHLEVPELVRPVLRHTLQLLANHFEVTLVEASFDALKVSNSPEADIRISDKFIDMLTQRRFGHHYLFDREPLILDQSGAPDYLGTCAYMVNYLQEYVNDPDCFDELDRFKYEKSYQYRFSCVTDNLVLEYLLALKNSCRHLQPLRRKVSPTSIWVSHDIDSLFHNRVPELKTAVKRFRLDLVWEILWKFHRNPDVEIFDKMLSLDQAYPTTTTYFWLASDRPFMTSTGQKIENANYDIGSVAVSGLMGKIKASGAELGVHQSLGCEDLARERDRIDPAISINRNHYLAGKLPGLWLDLEKAKIKRDATAGFSLAMGFRNSYGLPIQPFDPIRNKAFELMEYPLHIMDTTFMNQNLTPWQAEKAIRTFLNKHPTDCLISILWHNIYFSEVKYPGWGQLYHNILS